MASAQDIVESTFGTLLRQLRRSAGLTQEELAEAAALSPRSVSDLERGINLTARRETARLLADALQLTGPARAGFEAAARGSATEGILRAGGAAVATRTLPRDVSSFTGRGAEIAELLAATRAAEPVATPVVGIHAIGGLAGIGKTAFAVHVAHLLAPDFPDGQIFVPLHAHTPGQPPVDPADALASLLLTLGVGAALIPPGLDERVRLWRDQLVGKRLLLVLDDAAGHEQVRPLLPGTGGCLVLVTSRRHLTALEDVQSVSLDTLVSQDAASLFVRLAARPGLSAGDPAVREITRLCGYLPLAIGILARQLHHHPAWSLADLTIDVAMAQDRLTLMRAENISVAAAFDLSYRDLTSAQQRLFRLLGLLPGTDADAYAAAALDGCDLGTARARLDALYDQHLLTEPGRGRYRMHDLVREHARALASGDPAADREAAVERLLTYYVHTAVAADRHLTRNLAGSAAGPAGQPPAAVPRLDGRKEAILWMERERANLHAAAEYAAGHDQSAAALALASAMHAFLHFEGHWEEALALQAMAHNIAVQADDRSQLAGALTRIGDIQVGTRDYAAAAASLTAAMELYRELDDRPGLAAALTQLSATLYLTSDVTAADDALSDALELYRGMGDRRGQALVLSRLGGVRLVAGNYTAASSALSEALELCASLGDQLGEARARTELGAVLQATGSFADATANLEQALAIFRDLGDRLGEANALSDLAVVQHATADYSAATLSLTGALALYTELGDRLGRANVLNQLGIVHKATGANQDGADCLRQALELYTDLGDRIGEAEALTNLADITLAAGDAAAAGGLFDQAAAIAAEISLPLTEATALMGTGRCLHEQGQPGAAASAVSQALEIYRRIGSPGTQQAEEFLRELSS
jgi:tetratricopeptide (TPR) repeat protein/transcriptional regulator with XRE-family HTH domain